MPLPRFRRHVATAPEAHRFGAGGWPRGGQERAQIEPLCGIYDVGVVWFYYVAHQYDQAEAEYLKERALNPNFYRGYILGSVYLGRQQEVVADLQKEATASYHGILELMDLGHALGVTGDRAEGQRVRMPRCSQAAGLPHVAGGTGRARFARLGRRRRPARRTGVLCAAGNCSLPSPHLVRYIQCPRP